MKENEYCKRNEDGVCYSVDEVRKSIECDWL